MIHIWFALLFMGIGFASSDERCELHPDILKRIRKDLYPWKNKGITIDDARALSLSCPESSNDPLFCNNKMLRFTIDNGTLYFNNLIPRRKGHRPWVEQPGQMLELYETTLRYPNLPNVDMTISFGDEISGDPLSRLMPVLAPFKGDHQTSAILVPNSGHYRCVKDSVEALSHHLATLDAVPWSQKKEIAFGRFQPMCPHYLEAVSFRAGPSSPLPCPRTHLVEVTASHPDVLDVNLDAYEPLMNQIHWKYLINTDGVSCSNRLDKLLMLGSTVLKQHSPRYGWWYDALKPFVHYVPFFVDNSSDILQAVDWLKKNDDKAKIISEAGRKLAMEVLGRKSRLCFWKTLIEEYARLQTYRPSCRLHRMCVPAIKELTYLGWYENPPPAPKCNIHKQIDEINGRPMPREVASPWGDEFGNTSSLHGYDGWAFHDTEPLQEQERIRDWKPPDDATWASGSAAANA